MRCLTHIDLFKISVRRADNVRSAKKNLRSEVDQHPNGEYSPLLSADFQAK